MSKWSWAGLISCSIATITSVLANIAITAAITAFLAGMNLTILIAERLDKTNQTRGK